MTIECFGADTVQRVLVTVEAEELSGYGVTFGAMSLGDGPTRRLLRDLLSLVTRMGLRDEGERVRVDCTSTGSGGCALLISREEGEKYMFDSSDDIISAYMAGALPAGSARREGGRWVFRPEQAASGRQRRMLVEFCCGE